jgi:hypothetical protein
MVTFSMNLLIARQLSPEAYGVRLLHVALQMLPEGTSKDSV